MLTIHQVRHKVGIQQCPDQTRKQMESGISDKWRPVQTNGHVLWSYQLTGNIPNHDELDICTRNHRSMANDLHGQHGNPHIQMSRIKWPTTHCAPPTIHQQSPRKTTRAQSILETGKMYIRTTYDQIFGSKTRTRHSTNGWHQSWEGKEIANPKQCHRSIEIPRIHRLLLLLYQRLFKTSKATTPTHTLVHTLALGPQWINHLQNSMRCNV
jgi:hypothetical protein